MNIGKRHSTREADGRPDARYCTPPEGRYYERAIETDREAPLCEAKSGNRCAFSDCESELFEDDGTQVGELCHIRAKSSGGPRFDPKQTDAERHAFENLVLMCHPHHRIIDDRPDDHPTEALEALKADHEERWGRDERSSDATKAAKLIMGARAIDASGNAGTIVIDSSNTVVGTNVTINTTKRAPSVNPPTGTIGADANAARYVEYLISRYNQFAKGNPSRGRPFNYAAITGIMDRKFGARWRMLDRTKFDEVCEYLQGKIDRTRVGKTNRSKGDTTYSTFDQCLEKHS